MSKIEEKQFKRLAFIYEDFYGEQLDNNIDVLDKINSLAYILSSKFGINFVDDYYVTFIKEEQKLYAPLLMDLVHKCMGKVEKDDDLKVNRYVRISINLLKECLYPYLELHNDKRKAMNDLSVILYIKEHNPRSIFSEIASSENNNCTKFETSCILSNIKELDNNIQKELINSNSVKQYKK